MGFSFFTDLISPTKYDLPEAPTVDVDKEQTANVSSNYASFNAAKQLATDFNSFMRNEVAKSLKEAMPEYEGLRSQMAANLASQLRGELPTDVANQVTRRSAARSLALGVPGSPLSANLGARDLGITSLQLQSAAQAQTPGFMNTIASLTRAPLFDFSSTFLSPAQRIAMQFQNEENKFNVANLKAQMDAQPEPWMKALAGLGDSVLTAATGYLTMGGGLGGGGGIFGGDAGLSSMGVGTPSGWGSLSPFDKSMYRSQVQQGRMAGWGMNFE